MIINDLDDYYIVFDTKDRNTELDTLVENTNIIQTRAGEIVLYQPDANTHLEVRVDDETGWLTIG